MTKYKPACKSSLIKLSLMFCVAALSQGLMAAPTQAQSLEEILIEQDVAKMNAVIGYIEQNPEGENVEEAYSIVFRLAGAYDRTAEVLPLAEKYLESGQKLAEAKAACIVIENLVDQGKIEEAVDKFMTLARYQSKQDPNSAGNCGLELADEAQVAGQPELARKVLIVMREVLPLHPSFDRKCETVINKLDLVNKPAPELSITDFEDNPVKLEDFKGKVVLVDFWGTFCGPCIRQFPKMKETYAEFKDQGFEIVGISADQSQDQVDQFQEQYELPWKLAMSNSDEQATLERYLVEAFPSTYLIDREGKIIAVDLDAEILDSAVRNQFK
ncbi:Thiol-disulfide oxidoreductase ResA [Polystyrenella longa]|uniref:Thiol-disulfide oxidoreductase ResA n=1 Tax=Polystyrenella longa TaxID=2528007 RepID=A0A518CRV8_9PLAN|nr:redoxin domain-containing protein [Polystyrenella longa]QDU81953.1 Thiol-disulfide oxidoreductase ResA [Polystyrenella longa]